MTLLAKAVERVDGRLKVMGAAKYAAEFNPPDLVYAVTVGSTVPIGVISHIDTTAAKASPGVLMIMTPQNAPRLTISEGDNTHPSFPLLQDNRILFSGQNIAVVVASSWEQAQHAASLLKIDYITSIAVPVMSDNPAASDVYKPKDFRNGTRPPDSSRGDADAALSDAAYTVDAIYRTPVEHHNPMEPHATVAVWSGDKLTLYDATQGVHGDQQHVASFLGIPVENVRVVSPYVGGGFGCKGNTWPHVTLAAMAAKIVGRPVKLVLSRKQMFVSNGFRPKTVQHLRLGASADGHLTAIKHDGVSQNGFYGEFSEPVALATEMMYSCPNVSISHRLVKVNQGMPTYMRAPGEATGMFALESAIDELSYELKTDPIQLRLQNYAGYDEAKKKPFSSKSLKECYLRGATAFGWTRRAPTPGALRQGRRLIGFGMASATYPMNRSKAAATVTLNSVGIVTISCGSQDIGTGTYTIMAQLAADELGLPLAQIRTQLGDSALPVAPVSGGSQTVASIAPAVQQACRDLKQKLATLAIDDVHSPLHAADPTKLIMADGRISTANDPARGEKITSLMERHRQTSIQGNASIQPGDEKKEFSMHSFGAHFTEVAVDPDFGEVRVTRHLGAFAAGRILNTQTARSQFQGGIIFGMGMALMEETEIDPRWGRPMNSNMADYLLPVNADVPEIEVLMIEEEDKYVNPLGAKGIGELPMVGVAAAICNAVYNATGTRIRDLPIRPEKLLMTV